MRLIPLFALALLMAAFTLACNKAGTSTPAPTPSAAATSTPTSQASPGGTPEPQTPPPMSTPAANPGDAATPTPAAGPTATLVPFFLDVMSPEHESVVRQQPVEVRGRTVPDGVVTVNGQEVPVQADGSFTFTVPLEEGPNVIEVIASDFEDHQEAQAISVVYTP